MMKSKRTKPKHQYHYITCNMNVLFCGIATQTTISVLKSDAIYRTIHFSGACVFIVQCSMFTQCSGLSKPFFPIHISTRTKYHSFQFSVLSLTLFFIFFFSGAHIQITHTRARHCCHYHFCCDIQTRIEQKN